MKRTTHRREKERFCFISSSSRQGQQQLVVFGTRSRTRTLLTNLFLVLGTFAAATLFSPFNVAIYSTPTGFVGAFLPSKVVIIRASSRTTSTVAHKQHALFPSHLVDSSPLNAPASSTNNKRYPTDTTNVQLQRYSYPVSLLQAWKLILQDDATATEFVLLENSFSFDILEWLQLHQPVSLKEQPLVYLKPHNHPQDKSTSTNPSSSAVLERVAIGNVTNVQCHYPQTKYGGQRFDTNNNSPCGNEWSPFGQEFWIYPVLEFRVQSDHKIVLRAYPSEDRANLVRAILSQSYRSSSAKLSPVPLLPPILAREDTTDHSVFETSIQQASSSSLSKVVIARQQVLHFATPVSALDMVRKWKLTQIHGHLFYLQTAFRNAPVFVGCTPERLFRMTNHQHQNQTKMTLIQTEALAGTRPRGSTPQLDQQLLNELINSPKDQRENSLTKSYIENILGKLDIQIDKQEFFVRRLNHLQHLCQSFQGHIIQNENSITADSLLDHLHPTPAVCGLPVDKSLEFIREHESGLFDRGYYSGPVGYIGPEESDVFVALRSALVDGKRVLLYAGAGIVQGSTVQAEWTEINQKLGVVSSIFPQSPITLQKTPNQAWSAIFIEELIRSGITQFYICPGSRSTPLVVAVTQALRNYKGLVHAESVHDERAAAFRALGYARGANRPAAVITSSGTAVANLYPAVVEAGMDAVPMILLTADRPYESRDTGANQAIDQLKIFSGSYIRWFRDIAAPTDDIPATMALSDASHAVHVATSQRGPVHVNIQFRENLAPEGGPVRNDNRLGSFTRFDSIRFADTPKFRRWSLSGGKYLKEFSGEQLLNADELEEIIDMIYSSRRSMIFVGNVRGSQEESLLAISDFAYTFGIPIVAGVQAASLRFMSSAVIPFAEHVLKARIVSENLKPDLVIQIGAPLVSTAMSSVLENLEPTAAHVLIHPHSSSERIDPSFSVTHRIAKDVTSVLRQISDHAGTISQLCGSELAPLVTLGQMLRTEMNHIVYESSRKFSTDAPSLSEPEIVVAIANSISESDLNRGLFLSNSMPIRDSESLLYPFKWKSSRKIGGKASVATNRGASGIDGIISSALGFSEALKQSTTLVIGDLAALHDLNSFHSLSTSDAENQNYPLTTIIVNNNGGGIFSFLPISKFGDEVGFDDYFGTPTQSFSFQKGTGSFGINSKTVHDMKSLSKSYREAICSGKNCVIEAVVCPRADNVKIHTEISSRISDLVGKFLSPPSFVNEKLSIKINHRPGKESNLRPRKTLVLMHGWMGEKEDWDRVVESLDHRLKEEWNVLSIDLPGHETSLSREMVDMSSLRLALGSHEKPDKKMDVDSIALRVLDSLEHDHGIESIQAIGGYSLGGRIALAMKRLSTSANVHSSLVAQNCTFFAVSSHPGALTTIRERAGRLEKDSQISKNIRSMAAKNTLLATQKDTSENLYSSFVRKWYANEIWGRLVDRDDFHQIVARRVSKLKRNARDMAKVLEDCSPPLNPVDSWKYCDPERTIFISGDLDEKYTELGKDWSSKTGIQHYIIKNSGHAILHESPSELAGIISSILREEDVPIQVDGTLGSQEMEAKDANEDSSRTTEIQPVSVIEENHANDGLGRVSNLNFAPFGVKLTENVVGIGWKNGAKSTKKSSSRIGYVIELEDSTFCFRSVGEASPLEGLHNETIEDVQLALENLSVAIQQSAFIFDPKEILRLDGYLSDFVTTIMKAAGIHVSRLSVRSALEMAVVGLAAQHVRLPPLQAMSLYSNCCPDLRSSLKLNGLITRGSGHDAEKYQFDSIKVKIGHQSEDEDANSISRAFFVADQQAGQNRGRIRADANRAWNESQAIHFCSSLDGLDLRASERVQYIEEPLERICENGVWDIANQVDSLERFFRHTGIQYALDESIADLMLADSSWEEKRAKLQGVFSQGKRGCAAFILKPAVLGLEESIRLARFARKDLNMSAVFTSAFESGIGLAYTSFLAALSDSIDSGAQDFSHGLGTFVYLNEDTISPSFDSYVSHDGTLSVSSLSRAFYGLALSDLSESTLNDFKVSVESESENFESSSSTDKNVRLVVSLPLPFSAEIAAARFTDLPQQPRWSPWLASVSCEGESSAWKLNVRGLSLTWRAQSVLLSNPPGIAWKTIPGQSTVVESWGRVEFIPTTTTTNNEEHCQMKVRMIFVPPKLIESVFQGNVFVADFVRDKILKWSLEMFRDTVLADLAVERGEVEVGDALIHAVEGKATAMEATLWNTIKNQTTAEG